MKNVIVMPIYLYECKTDGQFEKLVGIHDSELKQECPTCKECCERIFGASGGGFQLKGEWFKTSGRY